jgi:biofilm PGA synthesis N-glycosyltransferase PgaC
MTPVEPVPFSLAAGAGRPAPFRPDLIPATASFAPLLMQRPLPIAYFAGVFPLQSETFVYREVRALRRRGWTVDVVSLRKPATPPASDLADLEQGNLFAYGRGAIATLLGFGSELAHHPLRTAHTLLRAFADAVVPRESTPLKTRARFIAQAAVAISLVPKLRTNLTSHIHCHFAHAPTTIGMYAAMQLEVPFSFTGHANDLFHRRALLKRKLQRAAFVSCISRWHRSFYREAAPADDSVYRIIRCGVETGIWTTEAKQLQQSAVGVLTVCRLVEKKGVDLLLRGLARWKPARGWSLMIAGDGPERPRLEELVKSLGIGDHVTFLGAVGNERVRELLASAEVFALPCRTDSAGDRDGIPVVLIEAMACGVPVVTGDLPAIRELVVPGISGLLVNSNRPEKIPAELVTVFERLTSDSALRKSLRESGRAMVQREFDLEENVARLESNFEKTVRQHRGFSGTDDMVIPQASDKSQHRRYALITPCRDEAKYARITLECVAKQTIPPALWVIVDDGSKDETPAILAEYAARYPFIRIITRPDRGERKLGGGVIDAFYTGYDSINPDEFDYICKLDLDLDLPNRYFESLMERMETNPRIGTASGKPFYTYDGHRYPEVCGDENSVGMVKFYRVACFRQIGGFVRELMWDGIDCHRCRMAGWIAVSWCDPEIRFEHLRPMGTSHKNWWTGRVRHGVGQWFMGTGLIYMLASSVYRMGSQPRIIGGIAMLWGYLRSALQGKPRYQDWQFRKFLRKYQRACLMHGKTVATETINREQSKVWDQMHASAKS